MRAICRQCLFLQRLSCKKSDVPQQFRLVAGLCKYESGACLLPLNWLALHLHSLCSTGPKAPALLQSSKRRNITACTAERCAFRPKFLSVLESTQANKAMPSAMKNDQNAAMMGQEEPILQARCSVREHGGSGSVCPGVDLLRLDAEVRFARRPLSRSKLSKQRKQQMAARLR